MSKEAKRKVIVDEKTISPSCQSLRPSSTAQSLSIPASRAAPSEGGVNSAVATGDGGTRSRRGEWAPHMIPLFPSCNRSALLILSCIVPLCQRPPPPASLDRPEPSSLLEEAGGSDRDGGGQGPWQEGEWMERKCRREGTSEVHVSMRQVA